MVFKVVKVDMAGENGPLQLSLCLDKVVGPFFYENESSSHLGGDAPNRSDPGERVKHQISHKRIVAENTAYQFIREDGRMVFVMRWGYVPYVGFVVVSQDERLAQRLLIWMMPKVPVNETIRLFR